MHTHTRTHTHNDRESESARHITLHKKMFVTIQNMNTSRDWSDTTPTNHDENRGASASQCKKRQSMLRENPPPPGGVWSCRLRFSLVGKKSRPWISQLGCTFQNTCSGEQNSWEFSNCNSSWAQNICGFQILHFSAGVHHRLGLGVVPRRWVRDAWRRRRLERVCGYVA